MQMTEHDIPGPWRDVVGYGQHIPRVAWPDEARVAVNVVINDEEGSEVHMAADRRNETILDEMSFGLESRYRDLALELVYECGARTGIWRWQRLFDTQAIPVTVFAAAVAVERNPAVARWLRDSAHELCRHGWRREAVWRLSRDEERAHLNAVVQSFEASGGRRPLGGYCRYGPSVNTRELLVEAGGFRYDADTDNDDLPYSIEVLGRRHWVVPYRFTDNDARFVTAPSDGSPSDVVDTVKRGLDYRWDEGKTYPHMMSIGLQPRLRGQAGRASALAAFVDDAQRKGRVWFARRRAIAQGWRAHHPEFGV